MDGLQWGSVAQWVSAILSTGSIALALFIILRDRRKAEEADARKVLCWRAATDLETFATHVLNGSDRVISEVAVLALRRGPEAGYESYDIAHVLRAKSEALRVIPRRMGATKIAPVFVTFIDAEGQGWVKEIGSGDLRRIPGWQSRLTPYLDEYVQSVSGKRRRPSDALQVVAYHRLPDEHDDEPPDRPQAASSEAS